MHSYASVTHAYAPICFHTPPSRLRTPITIVSHQTFSQKSKKQTTHRKNRKVIIAIGSAKSARIQPNMPNSLKNKHSKHTTCVFQKNNLLYDLTDLLIFYCPRSAPRPPPLSFAPALASTPPRLLQLPASACKSPAEHAMYRLYPSYPQ